MVTPVSTAAPTEAPPLLGAPVQPVIEPSPVAPVTTPAAPPVAQAPTVPPVAAPLPFAPSEVEVLRRQLAQVQAERDAQAAEAALTQEARTVQQEAMRRGMNEEDALWAAQQHYLVARRVMDQQRQLLVYQQNMEGKRIAASEFGKQYGVDPSLLLVANNPQEMEAIAQREKRYAALEAQVKALNQTRAPAQMLDTGNSIGATSTGATADNIDKLWLDYERAHPNSPNPYEAQYRKLLGM